MKYDLTAPKPTNFEATSKDLKDIMFKLLESEKLAKLLKYNTSDALTKPNLTKKQKFELLNNNIKIVPKLPLQSEKRSSVIVLFDNFVTNANNPEYRDNTITFDVVCHIDDWIMEDYMLRPYCIMHEIDGMFNNQKLNGIGKVQFVTANSLVLSDSLAGFSLVYRVINDI